MTLLRRLFLLLLLSSLSLFSLGAASKALAYTSVLQEEVVLPVKLEWKIQNLKDSSLGYDDNLAKAAVTLSRSIYLEDDTLERNLKALGFTHYVFYEEDGISCPAVAFAHQKHTGTNFYAIVVRGTASFNDVLTDFKALSDSFAEAAENTALTFLEYLDTQFKTSSEKAKKEKNVFFITGHSLGGAVANILSLKMEEYAGKDSIFTYTFSSPYTGMEYNSNALNIINGNDFVPTLPLPEGRNGQDIIFMPEQLDEETYRKITGEELEDIVGFTILNKWNNHILDTMLTYVLSRENNLLLEWSEE